MWLLKALICVNIGFIVAIYVPSNTKKPLSNIGVKTIGWQAQSSERNLIIHQNYSNVKLQQHADTKNLDQIYEDNRSGRYLQNQQQILDDMQQAINNFPDESTIGGNKQTCVGINCEYTQNFEATTADLDQTHYKQGVGVVAKPFGRYPGEDVVQRVDECTGSHCRQANNFESLNGQQNGQQNENVGQQNANVGQQTDSFPDVNNFEQQSGFDQQNEHFGQQTNSFPDENNFERQSGFDQQTGHFPTITNVEQHTSFKQKYNFGQQSSNFDQQNGQQNSFGHKNNFDQQNGDFDQITANSDQVNSNFPHEGQHTSNFEQISNCNGHNCGPQTTKRCRGDDCEDETTPTVPTTVSYENHQRYPRPQNYYSGKLQAAPTSVNVYSKCPSGTTGQFVYEYSCNQFLNCWKGRGYPQNCAPGTLFNPKTLECDYADKVECVSGPGRAQQKPVSAKLQAGCPAGFSGIMPHYGDCSKFINCANGIENFMDCAPGTLFDVKSNVCDFPYKTKCVNGGNELSKNVNQQYNGGGSSYNKQNVYDQYSGDYNHQYNKQNWNQEEIVGYNKQTSHQNGYGGNYEGQSNFYGSTLPMSTPQGGGFTIITSNKPYGTGATRTSSQDVLSYGQHYTRKPSYRPESGSVDQTNAGSTTNDQNYFGHNNGYGGHANVAGSTNDYHYKPNIPQVGDSQSTGYSGRTRYEGSTGGSSTGSTGYHQYSKDTQNTGGIQSNAFGAGSYNGQTNGGSSNYNGHTSSVSYSYDGQASAGSSPHNRPTGSGSFPYNRQTSASSSTNHGHASSGNYNRHTSSGTYNGQTGAGSSPQNGPAGSDRQTNIGSSTYNGQTGSDRQTNVGSSTYNGQTSVGNSDYNGQTSAGSSSYNIQTSGGGSKYYGSSKDHQNGDQTQDHFLAPTQSSSHHQNSYHVQNVGTTPYPAPPVGFHSSHGVGQNIASKAPYTKQSSPKCPDHHTGLLPHPYVCSKFLNCANGITYIQDCAPGTLFNSLGGICDFPYNVRCSNYVPPSQHYEVVETTTEYYSQATQATPVSTDSVDDLNTAQSNNRIKHWPPPFPSTDLNADYVFEYEDINVSPEAEVVTGPLVMNWCDSKGFECGNKVCVAPYTVCDGIKNCPNGKDEISCDDNLHQFDRIPNTKLAVRETEKVSNITLKWCAKMCLEHDCKAFNYRQHDGVCFILSSNVGLSGALIILPTYDYYECKAYTVDCSQGYLCRNKKCLMRSQICDGSNDCGDGMDEKGCDAHAFGYKISLEGAQQKNAGRIVVEAFGKSGYVCDDMFGLRNADVACKELGFPLGAVDVKGNSYFAEDIQDNNTFYMMDDVSCLGNETSLRDCDFGGWGIHNCRAQEIVGVICKTPTNECPEDHWQCNTGNECLLRAFLCDEISDCTDESDEDPAICKSKEEFRLVGGSTPAEGRLEVKHFGIWGTVCDDDFNDDAAKVVCGQMGYQGSAAVRKDGYYGPGSGPIWLDQVFCGGNETSLLECSHWEFGEHNCGHDEDVGIVCSEYNTAGKPRNINLEEEFEDVSLPTECGYRSDAIFREQSDVHFRVVQGSVAAQGEYPWQASIRIKGKARNSHWCGAIVISEKFVLTAAHCLVGFSKGAYFVVAGDYNVDTPEGTEQEAYIDDFIIHEEFRSGNKMNNDIALVRLKGRGFRITKDVQPICLPENEMDYPQGLNCTISGFGSIENGKSKASHDLRAGWLPLQSTEVCKMPHVYGAAITPGMMCAGFLREGVDACDGDSGGPLACLHNGVFTLFGITSWGQHCGYANKPGVYVRVSHYRNWIEETMKKLAK